MEQSEGGISICIRIPCFPVRSRCGKKLGIEHSRWKEIIPPYRRLSGITLLIRARFTWIGKVYEEIWKDGRVQSVAIFLEPGGSMDKIRKQVATQFPGLDRTMVANSKMKENILLIFDKTFAPTAP